jgi:hypothetical protein
MAPVVADDDRDSLLSLKSTAPRRATSGRVMVAPVPIIHRQLRDVVTDRRSPTTNRITDKNAESASLDVNGLFDPFHSIAGVHIARMIPLES